MRGSTFFSLLLLLGALALVGCGSKISEANFYRVQYGMTEEEVEDLLGPAHEESTVPVADSQPAGTSSASVEHATTSPTSRAARVEKSWSRDGIVIRVVFEDGAVTSRTVERNAG